MRITAIIQARLGSTRLCHKVLLPIGHRTVLDFVIEAALDAECVDRVDVTTPDVAIWRYVKMATVVNASNGGRLDSSLYVGPRNPLREYRCAAQKYGCDLIVRLTADCPMLTGEIIDKTVKEHLDKMPDIRYTYNGVDGQDVEVFDYRALDEAFVKAGPNEREHVTTWIRSHLPCQYLGWPQEGKLSVNTAEDLEKVRSLMG